MEATILAVVLGIINIIQFFVNRHDNKSNRFAALEKKIDALATKVDVLALENAQQDAVSARARILGFGDELLEGRRHSKDSWDSVLLDIKHYEAYTERDKLFENEITKATIKHIRKGYAERLEKRDFL